MSSVRFAARLRVSQTLRKIVLASGGVLASAGVVLICGLPVAPAWRAVLAIAWAVYSGWQLVEMRRSYMTFAHIEVQSDGAIRLRGGPGAATRAEILPGSVLLSRLGWLRMQTSSGHRVVELMCGNPRKNKDWRRLHVIWRHL